SWRNIPFAYEATLVSTTWAMAALVLLVGLYATKQSENFSRLATVFWFIVTPLPMLLWRRLTRTIMHYSRLKGYDRQKVAIVGANAAGTHVAQVILQNPDLGYDLLGFYDDRKPDRGRTDSSCEVQGRFETLVEKARNGEVNQIYITLPINAKKRIVELISALSDTTVSVFLIPDLFMFNLFYGQQWQTLHGVSMVSVFQTPFTGPALFLKRVQDIVLSVLILIIISPVMLITALAVKFSSPGPALFRQKRYGIDGREFTVWKFRSMTTQEDGNSVAQAVRDDPRVTRVGAFIRRTSLDELPQFFNVLAGTMSIVGPRPHAVVHNEHYRLRIKGYMLRHAVRPGITGWAQVNGWRGETETQDKMEERIQCDLWYIQNWSTWLDIKIIILTIFRGFSGKNAY
ncbi:MAG TPA: undecaprenyl-phosphate glucose phosphotransferase, partial [Gammaproteobacteria bacterium]|nr:undecaprenyl-phosphate glucose phosphotransferase [Gammaproteobacteria bacterium]